MHCFFNIWHDCAAYHINMTYESQVERNESIHKKNTGSFFSNSTQWICSLFTLDRKARFARVRAARGWNLPYQGSCIDPRDQSYPLDLTWEVPFLRLAVPCWLLIKDLGMWFWLVRLSPIFLQEKDKKRLQSFRIGKRTSNMAHDLTSLKLFSQTLCHQMVSQHPLSKVLPKDLRKVKGDDHQSNKKGD